MLVVPVRRRTRLRCCRGVVALFGFVSVNAAASEILVPEGCGTPSQFDEALRIRIGHEQARAALEATTLRIWSDLDGFRMDLRLGDEHRELRDESCEALFRAAVVIVVALQTPVALPRGDTDPPDGVPAAAESLGNPPRVSTLRISRAHVLLLSAPIPSCATHTFWVGSSAGLTKGLLPGWAPQVKVQLTWMSRGYGAFVAGAYAPPSESTDSASHGVRVRAAWLDIGAAVQLAEPLQLELGLLVARLDGRGIGSRGQDLSDGVWAVAPMVGALGTLWHPGSFRLSLGVDAALWFLPPRFEITEYGEVFRTEQLTVAGGLRVDYRFH